jgi:hypothetical protein
VPLLVQSNAVIEANSVLASTVDFPVKTAAIEASKQANEAFRLAIQVASFNTVIAASLEAKLPSPLTALLASTSALVAVAKAVLVKRTKADASVILAFRLTFNNYQEALQVKKSELEVKIQQAIAEDEARRVAQLWQDK